MARVASCSQRATVAPVEGRRAGTTGGGGVVVGVLLILGVGGFVSGLCGAVNYLETGNLIAGSPKVFAPLLKLVQDKLPDTIRG